jgi:hypothetical protein
MAAMPERVSVFLAAGLGLYALFGALFALAFVTFGVQRIDPGAKGSGVAFRLLIFSGSIALWPLLLKRWASGQVSPPDERNSHR